VGISFLFGELVTDRVGFVFALRILPIIIFFSSLMAVLYHLGIMRWVVRVIGGVFQKVIGTGRVESFCAAANIFVSQAEAPLVVRPYIHSISDYLQKSVENQNTLKITSLVVGIEGSYGNTALSKEFIKTHWNNRHFEVIDVIEGIIDFRQDLVILKRKPDD